jgi:hypothetical protein
MSAKRLSSLIFTLALLHAIHAEPAADSPNDGLMLLHDPLEHSSLLSFWGINDRFYFIQQSEDLVKWTFMPIFEVGSDDVISWAFRSNAPKLFYRAIHTSDINSELMQADYDEDGVATALEYGYGSHPFNPDTFGDGIFDGIAFKLGLQITPFVPPSPDPSDTTPPAIQLDSPTNVPLP